MILMIDNYDSFTYNLTRYCDELGLNVIIKKNDEITIDDIHALNPQAIMISPGPGTPYESGICIEAVQAFASSKPILGICLGHQVIYEAFGGHVKRAKAIFHGRTSRVHHSDTGLFAGLPQGFHVTRYHSLVAELDSLPNVFDITCWTLDEEHCLDEIMGIQHKTLPIYGVQFHPEALLTEYGREMIGAFFQQQGIPIDQSALGYTELQNDTYKGI